MFWRKFDYKRRFEGLKNARLSRFSLTIEINFCTNIISETEFGTLKLIKTLANEGLYPNFGIIFICYMAIRLLDMQYLHDFCMSKNLFIENDSVTNYYNLNLLITI